MFRVYVVFCSLFLVVITSAIDCLERHLSEMTYCPLSSGTLTVKPYAVTHSLIGYRLWVRQLHLLHFWYNFLSFNFCCCICTDISYMHWQCSWFVSLAHRNRNHRFILCRLQIGPYGLISKEYRVSKYELFWLDMCLNVKKSACIRVCAHFCVICNIVTLHWVAEVIMGYSQHSLLHALYN